MRTYSQPYREEEIDDDDLNDSAVDLKFRRSNANHQVIHRALSTVSANQTLVNNQRNVLAKNFRRISVNDEIVTIDHSDAEASFLLPNLFDLPDPIRLRVLDSLLDSTTMTNLEATKRLNWWVNKKVPCPKLYPLLTTGDGNCLLHATSLAMWGFHDHSLSMRKALNETMITSKPNNSLYRRWRWAQAVQNKKYGLVFSEQEWTEEWKSLLRLSSTEPRISQTSSDPSQQNLQSNRTKSSQINTSVNSGGSTKSSSQSTRQYYESLEEFHVYVLANNIRRPIIIYSDTVLRTNDGEAISPIEFGGIYLPLEIPPEKCHKQPVFLAFDAAHFSALVPMEYNSKTPSKVTYRIPLIDLATTDLLPIHFFVDPGPDFVWPIDEELSDEKIHLYTRFSGSRMETLENYLNLSREISPLDQVTSSLSTSPIGTGNATEDESTSTQLESSSSITETASSTTPNLQKKNPRTSFNSFSKLIRRTFIEPFASSKRVSFKQRQNNQTDVSDTAIQNENDSKRRTSSPLLNPHTNLLMIIMTNFQPKRPKTTDNMIKNYIDACMNEYRLEKNKQKIVETSIDENHQSSATRSSNNSNGILPTSSSASAATATHYRSYTSTSSTRPQEPDLATTILEKRKINAAPNHTVNMINPKSKTTSKSYDIDDNDDSFLMDNGQITANINYVQRQSSNLTQSNSLEINQSRARYADPSTNGLSSTRIRSNQPNESLNSRLIQNPLPSSFQPGLLKRQQSLGYDRNSNAPRVTADPSTHHSRGSVKVNPSKAIRAAPEPAPRFVSIERQQRRRS